VFARGSRYAAMPEAIYDGGKGRLVGYVLLRPIPDPRAGAVHVVTHGDRLDRVAADAYGDPEQWWRICDANLSFDPDDLVRETGRRLTVPPAVS
jgi:hypothetical protein